VLPSRRLPLVLAAAGLMALPAAVLAGLCFGKACDRPDRTGGPVPFCSLPEELRREIADGFRDSRSPHVMAVTGDTPVEVTMGDAAWPSTEELRTPPVPLVFAGSGVSGGQEVPDGTRLDAVAPTLAEMMGLVRPDPRVRSGEAIPGLASGARPALVVMVTWKQVTSRALDRDPKRWPALRGLMEDGAATLAADPGALPIDSASVLNTIGTGALPLDHGITGALVRNDNGDVVEPWGKDSPFSIVAALGDHLDELESQAPRIGIVEADETDQGLIGGNWYVEHDRDDVVVEPDPAKAATAAEQLVATGYGADATPDLLGVTLRGPVRELDEALGRILVASREASGGSFVIAVTTTGSEGSDPSAYAIADVEDEVRQALGSDVIEAAVAGGFFLDQDEMTRTGLTADKVVDALRRIRSPDGDPLFADVFPSIAVTFARYC
jgi:hypothetical protein